MKIELKEITLDNLDLYDSNNYPESGIYKVNQLGTLGLVYVNKSNNILLWIDLYNEAILNPKKDSEGEITQDLFLKTIALLSKSDKFKELS